METNDLADSLELKGVKPTANRILVLKALKEQACPVSLTDLEDILATMDKSSIFRVLTLFLEHDIVHSFEDGLQSVRRSYTFLLRVMQKIILHG